MNQQNRSSDNDNITREEFLKIKQKYNETPYEQRAERPIKIPGKFKRAMKKSLKQNEEILVFYMNMKRDLEGPFLTKIYGGNFLVIRNHVYRIKPQRVLRWGNKYAAVIIRAWDRELVGCEDYDSVMAAGDDRTTVNDPVLIKAVIAAKLAEQQAKKTNMLLWAIIGIVVVGAIFFLFGKK